MRKKKHAEHVNHERWLVSWADLLTLLFAFFVVMFASSASDKKKAAKMAYAMQTAFQQQGAFDAHAKTPPLAPGAGTSIGSPKPLELPIETPDSSGKGDGDSSGADSATMRLAASVASATEQHLVKIHNTDEGTTLSLDSAGFFDSGSAEVKPSVMPVLQQIAAALPNSPLRVEGHTDNQPIHNAQFRSNWELSTARAEAITEILMRSSVVFPANFSIAGYAEFHPVAGNNTEEGRAANRRVDIVILRRKNAQEAPAKTAAIAGVMMPHLPAVTSSRQERSR
jgi:chemotaxis protein MotB